VQKGLIRRNISKPGETQWNATDSPDMVPTVAADNYDAIEAQLQELEQQMRAVREIVAGHTERLLVIRSGTSGAPCVHLLQ
jgi:hypothetical protein